MNAVDRLNPFCAAVSNDAWSKRPAPPRDHGVRSQPIGKSEARLELFVIGIKDAARLTAYAGEKLRAQNLERACRHQLRQLLNRSIARVRRQDLCVSRLRRVVNGVDGGGIEIGCQAVEAFRDGQLDIPAKTHVDG